MSSYPAVPLVLPPRRLCVLRLSAIGDTCHTLPVVRSLQATWPACEITWVIGTTESALLGDIPGIEFITFDKRQGWRALAGLRARMRGRKYDALLHMHASMRANLASLCIPSALRLGFDRARARDFQWLFTNHRIPARPRQHVIDALFGFAETLGATQRKLTWDIPVPASARRFADDVAPAGSPVVLISPCSSQRFRNFRNWSAANYAALASHAARRHGARVVLTGGDTPLERGYGRDISAAASTATVDLIGQTSLKQLLALIARADVVVCPDSGPAHIATAVGTPVLGLYATSNRHRTGPYLSQEWVVDKYPEAVRRQMNKRVEDLRWGGRVRDPAAMDLIRIDEVTSTLDRLLDKPPDRIPAPPHSDSLSRPGVAT